MNSASASGFGISSGSAHMLVISSVPALVVIRMMVLRKSTERPVESSRRPLSKTWKKSWITFGCAFSISSSRTTL